MGAFANWLRYAERCDDLGLLSRRSVAQVAPTTYAAAMDEGGATWELQWAEEAGMGCIWAL